MRKIHSIYTACILIAVCMSACSPITQEQVVPAYAVTTQSETLPTVITTAEPEPPKPQFAEVTFSIVGDNLIHSSIYTQAEQRALAEGNNSDKQYDFTYAYQNVADLISTADIAIINQETLITNGLYPPSTFPFFNSPPELGDHMLKLGFDVFTIANNHTLDKGADGLLACLDYWDGKENAVVAGAYRNVADKENIRIIEVNGVKFAILSYTEHLNGLSLPVGSEIIIGNIDVESMLSDIEQAEKAADFTIVALHWGVEDSDVISNTQRDIAKRLVDAGTDIIIGTHPHVMRDIELFAREDRTTAICAYSMGNFISAQSQAKNLIGGVLQFKVTVPLVSDYTVENTFSDIRFIPVVTHYDKGYKDLRLYKFSDYTRELAQTHGVLAYDRNFGYDYITEVLRKNINEEYLVLE